MAEEAIKVKVMPGKVNTLATLVRSRLNTTLSCMRLGSTEDMADEFARLHSAIVQLEEVAFEEVE